jgi:DNA modification methylase
MTSQILHGDCREVLKTLPDNSVHCCVTSPPYFGLRSYGIGQENGEIGQETTPDEYVAQLVAVFREVRRVLRDDGTCWLNLGDSYANTGGAERRMSLKSTIGRSKGKDRRLLPHAPSASFALPHRLMPFGLKPKDLIGIPWRCAFALQADGWYLRQDIIWHKPAPMPESVTDRCTKAHEYIFLLTKSARYFYDNEAVREESVDSPETQNRKRIKLPHKMTGQFASETKIGLSKFVANESSTRNRRSVWTINPQPYSQAHFAVFPPALIEPCILAGTSEKGCCSACGKPWERVVERGNIAPQRSGEWKATGENHRNDIDRKGGFYSAPTTLGHRPACTCNAPAQPCVVLDPFGGSGTTGEVAQRLGREFILIELNPAYQVFQKARTAQTGMTFV